jgi:hypothetical protein
LAQTICDWDRFDEAFARLEAALASEVHRAPCTRQHTLVHLEARSTLLLLPNNTMQQTTDGVQGYSQQDATDQTQQQTRCNMQLRYIQHATPPSTTEQFASSAYTMSTPRWHKACASHTTVWQPCSVVCLFFVCLLAFVCLFVCCQASRLPLFIKPFHAITYPLQTAHMLLVARSYAVRYCCNATFTTPHGFSAFRLFGFLALSVDGATVDRLAQL